MEWKDGWIVRGDSKFAHEEIHEITREESSVKEKAILTTSSKHLYLGERKKCYS